MKGVITRDELQKFIDEIRVEIRSGTPIVYHISNSLALEKVELSLKAFQDLLKTVSLFGELGMQVDINQHMLNKMLAGFGGQFVRVRTRTVSTMAEAVTLLKKTDPTLEQLEWKIPSDVPETPTLSRPPMFAGKDE